MASQKRYAVDFDVDGKLIEISTGSPLTPAVILLRGYLNAGPGPRRVTWLESLRGWGQQGTVFELEWDASSPSRFASNLVRFRDWRALKERARNLGRHVLPRLLHELPHSGMVLVASSAGARIAYHALASGHIAPGKVADVVLLGGALRRGGTKDWTRAVSAIDGQLINVFSRRDAVLRSLYRVTSTGKACGAWPIRSSHPRVVNVDATDLVRGGFLHLSAHSRYQRALVEKVPLGEARRSA